jgi:DNA-binding FrmR family transcriptional regulator
LKVSILLPSLIEQQRPIRLTKASLLDEQVSFNILYRVYHDERSRIVSHTIREKAKLLNRVRRIRGQIEAVERALENEKGCADVLQLAVAARGALNSLVAEVIEDHIRVHVVDPARERNSAKARGAEELIDVVQAYLK